MSDPCRIPSIPDLLRHIRERDAGTTYHAGSVPRWDTLLADEVERLQGLLREATTGRMTSDLADRVWDAAGCGWGERG